jgi:hypothetical protein
MNTAEGREQYRRNLIGIKQPVLRYFFRCLPSCSVCLAY